MNLQQASSKTKVSEDAKSVAELYSNAKKAMIVYQQNFVTEGCSQNCSLIFAVISGHISDLRETVSLMVKAKNNSQGLVDIGNQSRC